MNPVKIVPKVCNPIQDEGGETIAPLFDGYVMMLPPTIEERMKFKRTASLAIKGNGEAAPRESGLDAIVELLPHLGKFVKEVSLKSTTEGYEIKSLDDLKCDPAGDAICIELASLLIKGFRPSKN